MGDLKTVDGDNAGTMMWTGSPEDFQSHMLPRVSRTFALNIPQLPEALRKPVTNAYLLCRIADTIEDEPTLDAEEKGGFENALTAVVSGKAAPESLQQALSGKLSAQSLPAERQLVANLPVIIEITRSLTPPQIDAIERCVSIMGRGMRHFQQAQQIQTLLDLDSYCYHVAGVVGEMLTQLFCDHSLAIAARRTQLEALAVSFGQGLQMTNILKDQSDDLARGVCWLPQQWLAASDASLAQAAVQQKLIGIAHAHLRNALEYCLVLPSSEPDVRRFCAWAVMLAVQTLQKVQATPPEQSDGSIKISRETVSSTLSETSACLDDNQKLQALFGELAQGLALEVSLEPRTASQLRLHASVDVPE